MDSMFILHYSYLMREYRKAMPINDVTGVHTCNMANNMYMYNSVYEIKILHQHIHFLSRGDNILPCFSPLYIMNYAY